MPLRAWAGSSGSWGAWPKEQQPSHPRRARLLERWLSRQESAQRQRLGWPWDSQAARPTVSRAARAGCWRTRSSGLSRAVQDVRSANNMNDATQPHFTLRSSSSQRYFIHRPRDDQDRLQSQKHGRHPRWRRPLRTQPVSFRGSRSSPTASAATTLTTTAAPWPCMTC